MGKRAKVEARTMREYRSRKAYLRYQFAMVLNTAKEVNVHVKIVEFLHKGGLSICLLDNDVTEDHVIVLISAEPLHDMVDSRHNAVRLPSERMLSSADDEENNMTQIEAPSHVSKTGHGGSVDSDDADDEGAGGSGSEADDARGGERESKEAPAGGAGRSVPGSRGASRKSKRPRTGATRASRAATHHEEVGEALKSAVKAGRDSGRPVINGRRLTTAEMSQRLLHREAQLVFLEQFLKVGVGGKMSPPPPSTQYTTAQKLDLGYRHIERVLAAVTFELGNSPDFEGKTAWDYVDLIFPLHDERWNKKFLRRYFASIASWRSWVPKSVRQFIGSRTGAVQQLGSKAANKLALSTNSFGSLASSFGGSGKVDEGKRYERAASGSTDESLYEDTDSDSDDEDGDGGFHLDDWSDPTEWAVEEIREHMGERVAFYFAFLRHYSSWLTGLAWLLGIWYLVTRWTDWETFLRGMSILGLAAPAVWAPLMLQYWKRASHEYEYKWGLMSPMPPEDHVNPTAEFKFEVKDHATGELRKKFDPSNNRAKFMWGLPIIILLNVAMMLITVAPFAQWYTFVRMAPLCECCEWHLKVGSQNSNATVIPALPASCEYLKPAITLSATPPRSCLFFVNCFDTLEADLTTTRGQYLAVQGAALGILLDVFQFEVFAALARKMTQLEHWPTEEEHERRTNSRMFTFMYVNVYFWFALMAYVYMPLGPQVQKFLVNIGLPSLVPMYGWVENLLSIDLAVIMPIVFNQLANLVLETAIPMVALSKVKKPPRVEILVTQKKMKSDNTVQVVAGGHDGGAHGGRHGHHVPGGDASTFTGVTSAQTVSVVGNSTLQPGVSPAAHMKSQAQQQASDKVMAAGGKQEGSGRLAEEVTDSELDGSWERMEPGSVSDSSPAPGAGAGVHVRVRVNVDNAPPGAISSPTPNAYGPGGFTPDTRARVSGAPMTGGTYGSPAGFGADVYSGLEEEDEEDDVDSLSTDELGELPAKRKHVPTYKLSQRAWLRRHVPLRIVDYTDDPNQYDADSVLGQANRDEFHPSGEYLDMLKQCGLILMLSCAWAWAPLTAVVNNAIESRVDALKMMRAMRRPIPRQDRGIGDWERVWLRGARVCVPVVSALIVLGTGELEAWSFGACLQNNLLPDLMTRDTKCFSEWGWRALAFIILERLGQWSISAIIKNVPDMTPRLRRRLELDAARAKRDLQDTLMSQLPGGLDDDMKFLFTSFDQDGNGVLSHEELVTMMDVLLKQRLPRAHMRMLLQMIDVDSNSTVSFAEFFQALRQCQDDFILKESVVIEDLAKTSKRLAAGIKAGIITAAGALAADGSVSELEHTKFVEETRAYLHRTGKWASAMGDDAEVERRAAQLAAQAELEASDRAASEMARAAAAEVLPMDSPGPDDAGETLSAAALGLEDDLEDDTSSPRGGAAGVVDLASPEGVPHSARSPEAEATDGSVGGAATPAPATASASDSAPGAPSESKEPRDGSDDERAEGLGIKAPPAGAADGKWDDSPALAPAPGMTPDDGAGGAAIMSPTPGADSGGGDAADDIDALLAEAEGAGAGAS